MGYIHSVKNAQAFTSVVWLSSLGEEPLEVDSPVFSIRIISIEYYTSSQFTLFYHSEKSTASSMVFLPGDGEIKLDLYANGMEISGQSRFFVVGHGEKFEDKDFAKITFVG